MSEYLEDHLKMRVLYEVAKKMPGGMLDDLLKYVDKIWIEELHELLPPKKKKAFVTKF